MTTPSKSRLRLWLRLLKLSRKIEAELRENLRAEFATTLPRFDVMSALSRYPGGLKMSELSGVLRVSNGNVTGIVDRLVEEGLVAREAVEGDRRAFRVRLLPEGQTEFARQAAAHADWIDCALDGVPQERAERLVLLLDSLTRAHGSGKITKRPEDEESADAH